MEVADADRLLTGLDDSQRRAVVEPSLPLAILAPAGSGKTRVLTHRIAWQSATQAIEPAHVLALTFTRKAAGELRLRLRRLGVRDGLTAGTFHAVALAQLRALHEQRGSSMPALLDRKARVLAPLIGGRRGPELTIAVTEAAGEIEWAQARLVGPGNYTEAATRAGRTPSLGADRIATIYRGYQDEKRKRHVIDFDDLVRLSAQALEQEPEFAATQRWRFRHLFVDEFQDVSRAQLRLLQAWLGERTDLCVVGDPDQAIYSFAGADPGYLTRFAAHFPGGATVHLERNYRSTPEIVNAARAVLPAAERAAVEAAGSPGPVPTVTTYPDGDAEARGVAERLRDAHTGDRPWSAMAVLYRVNAQSAPFEEALRRAGIPCRVRGDRAFLDRPEVQQALRALDKIAAAAPGRAFADHLTDLVTDATEASEEQRTHREAIVRAGPRVPRRRERSRDGGRVRRLPRDLAAGSRRRRRLHRRRRPPHVPPGQGPRVGHRVRHRPRARPRAHLARAGRPRRPGRGAPAALRGAEPGRAIAPPLLGVPTRSWIAHEQPEREPVPRRGRAGHRRDHRAAAGPRREPPRRACRSGRGSPR